MSIDPLLKQEVQSSGTSENRLLELATMDVALARLIGKGKYTPVSVLEYLAHSRDVATHRAVAANAHTPLPVLERLAQNAQLSVLKAIAINPHVSEAMLMQLVQHPQQSVRLAVLNRPHAPDAVLEALNTGYTADRHSLATYQGLSPAWIERLSQDQDPQVLVNLLATFGNWLPADLLDRYLQRLQILRARRK